MNRYYVTNVEVSSEGVHCLELTLVATGPFDFDEARELVSGPPVTIAPTTRDTT